MSAATFVQARMTSRRVPGKALTEIGGKPLLGYVLERATRAAATFGDVVVTTSTLESDDVIESYCADQRYLFYRGDLEDVAGRMVAAADTFDIEVIVRVSGDSPFVDHALIDQAVTIFRRGNADLVTNVYPRSFPVGMSVEVFSREMLTWARRKMTTAAHREHVTALFYEQPHLVRIANFAHEPDLSALRFTVDEPDDIGRIERMVAAMDRPHWSYSLYDVLALRESGHARERTTTEGPQHRASRGQDGRPQPNGATVGRGGKESLEGARLARERRATDGPQRAINTESLEGANLARERRATDGPQRAISTDPR